MISFRKAQPADAVAIAAVHVSAWRSTYPGLLPDWYLARLSVTRQAIGYERSILRGTAVLIAENDAPSAARPRIVGFTTGAPRDSMLGDSEVETLYVLDDWREQGVGRGLLAALAQELAAHGCCSAYCWVLRDNPSRWFYSHVGGREAGHSTVHVAGLTVPQVAFVWNPIDRLFASASGSHGSSDA